MAIYTLPIMMQLLFTQLNTASILLYLPRASRCPLLLFARSQAIYISMLYIAIDCHRSHFQAPSSMALYGGVDEWSVGYMSEWKLDIYSYTIFSHLWDMGRGEGMQILGVEGNVRAN